MTVAVSEASARAQAWLTGSSPTLGSTRTQVDPAATASGPWRRSSIHPQPISGSVLGPGTSGMVIVCTSGPASAWKETSRVRMAP